MTNQSIRVLIVDDEESVRVPLAQHLEKNYKYVVNTVANAKEALRLLHDSVYDVALIDQILDEETDSRELIKKIKADFPTTQVIVLTGWAMEEGINFLRIGAYRYFAKPFNLEELALTIQFATEESQTRQERRYLAALSALQELALTINSSLELDKILTQACKAAVEYFYVDHAGLTIFDAGFRQGSVGAEYPNLGLVGQKIPLLGISAEAKMIETQEPLAVYEIRSEESLGAAQKILHDAKIQSILFVPVFGRAGLIGSFSLETLKQKRHFTIAEIELCKTFANQVAVAIENAQLFHEVVRAREETRASFESSNALVLSQPTTKLIEDIILRAQEAAGATWVSVVLIDELGFARNLYATGSDNKLDMKDAIRPDGITMQVMRAGKIVVIEDTEQQRDRVNPRMFRDKVAAALCLPFTVQGKRIGVVWLHYSEPRHFANYEVEALQLFVNQAAIAYDNARRMEELEYMRKATEAIAGVLEPSQVLQQIVESASEVLRADSAAIWSYDSSRNQFIPEELVVSGIPQKVLEKLRKNEPKKGGTAYTLLKQGWIGVTDVSEPRLGFMDLSTKELLTHIGTKSFQGIALTVGDEKLGVLYCNYNHPRSFTQEDRRTLATFANHAALALKRSRLLEQLGKARDSARVVAQVSVLEDLTHTLDAIVRGTQEVLGCDAVTLYTYDEERDEFGFPPAMMGIMYPAEVVKLDHVSEQSVVRKMLALEQIHEAENAPSDSLMTGSFTLREQIKSAVGIPLRVGDRKVGVMFVNYRTSHSFTADEIINIELFANQAAVAIRNAQLLNEIKNRAEALEGLYSAGKVITSTLAVDEVLRRITDEALNIVGTGEAQGCFSHVALFDGTKLKFIAASPTEMLNALNSIEIDLTKSPKRGIDGQAAVTGVSLNVSNTNNYLEYIPIKENINSQLSVPLKVGGRVIGVLSIEHPNPAAFSDEDVLNVELLASQAAVALQNAQQYEELMQTKDLVGARTALAWMGMVSSTWRHAIEKHAITIRDQAELLRNDLAPSLESDRVDRRLDMIQRLANQILEKPMTAPLSSDEGVESVLVNYLIIERTKQLRAHDPYRNILLETSLELEDTATVRASPEWLRRALDILIDNAADAVSDSRQPKIIITTRSINTGVEIVVSDTGRGIPSEILKELFVVPIPSTNKLGLGLLFAQTIVQTYNGNIFCQETSARGTTMVIWFPRADLKEATATRSTITRFSTSPIEYERLYNELRRAYDELKELDKKKTEFLSTVSHELRTPLTSVKSCIENLLSGMYGFLNEKQQSRLDIALSGAREESRLIENLLDLARIQEGKSVLDLAQGDICKIIRDVAGVFRYDASQKDITITEELPNDEKIEILIDAGKVKQVITNLVSNALKFTPEEGIITIRARNLDTHVEIQVKDTGIGIPEEEFQKIFDRFYQVDSSLTRKVGGTGIGLNIAKEYVEMHGGRIWVESSKVGEGTIFTFTLPVK